MRSVFAYTASRLLLFAVAFGILYVLGARGFLALVLAFLISGLVSFVLLSKQRDAMSVTVAEGVRRMRGVSKRFDEGSAHEDDTRSAPAVAEPAADPETSVSAQDAPEAPGTADGETPPADGGHASAAESASAAKRS